MTISEALLQRLAPTVLDLVAAQRLSILIFHSIPRVADPLAPDTWPADVFDEQMGRLKQTMRVLPLLAAVEQLSKGSLPKRAVAITFDDGYRDNFEVAAPILLRHGLHATFFVSSGFLDGGRMFNDTVIETVRRLPEGVVELPPPLSEPFLVDGLSSRRQLIRKVLSAVKYLSFAERSVAVEKFAALSPEPLPDSLMMSSEQVAALDASGMEVGGHTVDHPILARVSPDEAAHQIAQNKKDLEAIVGRSLRLFAYPNGKPGLDYRPEHRALVEELGYSAATSTSRGVAGSRADRFQLPRFTPWDLRRGWFEAQLLRNAFTKETTI